MELSSLPPVRSSAATPAPVGSPDAALSAQMAAARPETTRPVEAVEPPADPAPIKGLGIPPLNMAQVGDNDDIPVPPDPEATASRPQRIGPGETGPITDPARNGIPQLLSEMAGGPPNPTVNMRS